MNVRKAYEVYVVSALIILRIGFGRFGHAADNPLLSPGRPPKGLVSTLCPFEVDSSFFGPFRFPFGGERERSEVGASGS